MALPDKPTQYPSPQLAEAVSRARRDPSAFRPIYDAYFRRVYHYCLRRVRRAQDAQDLTSVVFVRALAGLSSYRGGSFAAWLFAIAHNVVANHIRDRRETVALDAVEDVVSAHDDSLERIVDDEERIRLEHLIVRLDEDERELLVLRITAGLTAREVGEIVGKSEGAVRVAIHRIVAKLRDAWNEESAR